MIREFSVLLVISWFLSSPVGAQELDITQYITAMMKCNTEEYDPSQGEFNIDAFNEAWSTCAPSREALLEALPAQMRPAWEVRLEKIRTSVIDNFQPQVVKKGYGLNPENPVLIGGIEAGPKRTYEYFAKLRTSAGQPVRVHRIGSCCRFKTANAVVGDHAALDKYELTSAASEPKTIVYVNIYDEGDNQAVEGFVLDDDN